MKKSKLLIFTGLIIVSLLLLTGCKTKNGEKDIEKYVKEELKLSNIEVSKECKEIKDEEGYTDKLWTVTDKENNIVFHVLDNSLWSAEWLTNKLENDYNDCVFLELYSEINRNENIKLENDNSTGLNNVSLICNFKNENELRIGYESLTSYKEYIDEKGFSLDIYCYFKYDFPIREISDYEVTLGDSRCSINDLSKEKYKDTLTKYFACALNYQIEDSLEEMNESDLNNIMNNTNTERIYIMRENGEKEYYSDIIANEYSYGISFGTLYKILKKEKFNVKGDAWHYTVTTKSGDKYEFSYDFNNMSYEDGKTGYYYLKNDNKIKMNAYFDNHLKPTEINEMFGLNINTAEN